MWFFRKARHASAVLIDLSASRAAGAYAYYPAGSPPVICYSAETPVQPRAEESLESALLRALDRVGQQLIEEGAPELRRQTGSGRPDDVIVSVAAPWQDARVRRQAIAPGKEFAFTRRVLREAVLNDGDPGPGRVRLPDLVVATILNGYDVPEPIGMRAKRAEVIVLTASIDATLHEEVRRRVRRLYHTHDVSFTSFAAAAYSALRAKYPHERDFLILDVSPRATDLAFVKEGRLADVASLPSGVESLLIAVRSAERLTVAEEAAREPAEQPGYVSPERNARFSKRTEEARAAWVRELTTLFRKFAERHALPRTLFLIADPTAHDYLRRTLDSSALHALWLSDEPLTVVSVTAEQLASAVRARGQGSPDAYLSLLALSHRPEAP